MLHREAFRSTRTAISARFVFFVTPYIFGRRFCQLMRESKKTERMHLPRDSIEVWLESQTPAPSESKHRSPPEDTYEAWIKKRTGKRGMPAKGKKIAVAP